MKSAEDKMIFEYVGAVEAYYEAVPRIGDCPEGDADADPELFTHLRLTETQEWRKFIGWLDTRPKPPEQRVLAAGEVLYCAQDPADTLWLVRRGAVLVQRVDEARGPTTLDIVGAGRCVGWLALRQGACQEFQAQAVGECTVLGFSRAELACAIEAQPELGLRLGGILALRLEQAQHWAASLGAYPAAERVAHLLARLACEFGCTASAGACRDSTATCTEIDLRLNQEDLSRMVGTTRETVSHSLQKLRDSGAVLRARSPYVVDVAALRRYSE